MGEDKFASLGDPFYTSRDERFKVYRDSDPSEHQMVVDGEHYVGLIRGTLDGVARGEHGALDYVMVQLRGVEVTREEVEKALLRGKVAELEKRLGAEIKENFELRKR